MERNELLRMLQGQTPGPQNPERRLTLPSPEDVAAADPAAAPNFVRRRGALFAEYNRLRDRISHLETEAFCRYQLLSMLFGDGSGTVGECWQRVLAVRGAGALYSFETTLATLLQSGCITVHNPE